MDTTDKQTTEQVILAAAEKEFLAKGYNGARTTSIAEAAGVTHAMLHYYFRTKEQLFDNIVDKKFRQMSESMLTILGNPSLPIIERIKGGIAAHFDFVAANPLLPRFVINEIISRPERYDILYGRARTIVDSMYNNLQAEIDRAAEQGMMERVDAKMLFISIMSLNIFTFIAFPFMKPVMGELMAHDERFLSARKAENIETIMRRIQTNKL